MAKRDLVVIFKCELLPDGSIITYGKSVNDPREPESIFFFNFVQFFSHFSFFILFLVH